MVYKGPSGLNSQHIVQNVIPRKTKLIQTGKFNCFKSIVASALTCIDSEFENNFP